MENPGIGNVDLRSLSLPLFNVFLPWLENGHGIGGREDIQITPHRRVRHAEGTTEFGRVPALSVVVGQHRPEPTKSQRRDRDAKLRDVSLQKCLVPRCLAWVVGVE